MVSKAQVSAEFFVLLGLAFLITITFEIASLDQLNDFRNQKETQSVKDLGLKLQKEVVLASIVEDGYVRTFEVPDKLENIDYSLITLNSTVIIQSKNVLFTVSIPTSVGNLSKGTNIVNKTGDVIYINTRPTTT